MTRGEKAGQRRVRGMNLQGAYGMKNGPRVATIFGRREKGRDPKVSLWDYGIRIARDLLVRQWGGGGDERAKTIASRSQKG